MSEGRIVSILKKQHDKVHGYMIFISPFKESTCSITESLLMQDLFLFLLTGLENGTTFWPKSHLKTV